MNYWIFVVTSHEEHGVTGEGILRQRMQDKFWGLGERTPNRKSLQAGDQVVFYLGNPAKAFVASAVLDSPSYQLSSAEAEEVSHDIPFYRAPYGVRLKEIEIWTQRRAVEGLLPALSFIENKKSWGTYFQGGVKGISEQDFRFMSGELEFRPPSASVSRADTLDAAAEFALELHLEEFIDKNWDLIDFGRRLTRYKTEEQNGRQFPAGEWSIDFLCVDKADGDFVVIELKRGKSSDTVIGQTLRYMTWVRENLAKSGQTTHGIIIAGEADETMQYAARSAQNISLLEYRVDFKLRPVQK